MLIFKYSNIARTSVNVEALELRGYLESLPFISQKTTIKEIPDDDKPVSIFDTNVTFRRQMGQKSFDFRSNYPWSRSQMMNN